MNCDSYYEIGAGHVVCQDYAKTGTIGNMTYALVSDGCSGSKNTDIGSRLLVLAAEDIIQWMYQSDLIPLEDFEGTSKSNEFMSLFQNLLLKKISELRNSLNLDISVFDATLAGAIVNEAITVFGWGDSTFIFNFEDGHTTWVQHEYEPNMPYYLSYRNSQATIYRYHKENPTGTLKRYVGCINNDTVDEDYTLISLFEDFYQIERPSKENPIKSVTICSDGINTYKYDPKSEQQAVNSCFFPIAQMVQQITDYRNYNGQYVERRMLRLAHLNKLDRIIHEDDISVASIVL